MGLPSGLQWASCNVGAEKLNDPGLYFSWGNIEGHSEDEGYNFSQVVYDSTPAADIATDLSLSQDAARVNLGTLWRMPTSNEIQELFDNCTSLWTALDDVYGLLLTSNVNGNKLFLPAAGYFDGMSLRLFETGGNYWSSTYLSASNARRLDFNSSSIEPQFNSNRRFGFTIRAVFPAL